MPLPTVLGGLEVGGLDCQSANIYLDLIEGYFEKPEVRGKDRLIPYRPGRLVVASRTLDHLRIELEGWVRGTGDTPAERQESWHTATQSLMAVMDLTLMEVEVSVIAPYLGLASGSVGIMARPIGRLPGRVHSTMSFQRWTFELEAVTDPIEWGAGS